MAIGKLNFNMNNYRSPTAEASDKLMQFGSRLVDSAKQDELLEYNRARQAKQDEWNQELQGRKRADWAKADKMTKLDQELATRIAGINPTMEKSTMVSPAITQQQVNAERDRLTNLKYEDAGNKYANEFAKLTAPTTGPGFDYSGVVPSRNKVETKYDTVKVPGTGYEKYIDKATGEELAFDPKSFMGRIYGDKYKSVITPVSSTTAPSINPADAHRQALAAAGLSDNMVGKEFKVDPKIKAKSAKYKTEQAEIGKKEWLKQAQKTVLDSGIPFSQQDKLLDRVNKLADAKYGKSASAADSIALAKLRLNEKELNEKIKKDYFGKSKKSGKGSVNVGEELYNAAAEAGGSGDVEAVTNWLRSNRNMLNTLGKDSKKELVARLKAQYGREDEWLSTTGWDDLKTKD